MIQDKKIFRKKIMLLTSCLFILVLNMWTQDTYKKMQPLPIILENDQGMIIYRNHVILELGNFFYFILPNEKEYQIWMQINKGNYFEVNSEKICIDMFKAKKYKKDIYISFLGKNYITGEKKHQTYIFKGTGEYEETNY